jgi:hypothetical protein
MESTKSKQTTVIVAIDKIIQLFINCSSKLSNLVMILDKIMDT